MKNKKIISLVCALSMIISMFAGFTVVKADETPGIVLETTDNTTTGATVTAKYVGFDDGIVTAKVIITVPEGVTVTSATTPFDSDPTINDTVEGQYLISFAGKKNATSEGNVVAVFNLSFNDLGSNKTVSLTGDTYIGNLNADGSKSKYALSDETLAVATTTVKADPSATEPPTPIEKPPVTDAPKPAEKPEVVKGIALSYDGKDDDAYVVTAKYVGFDDGIVTSKLTVTVPEGATVEGTTPFDSDPTINDTVDGQYLISFAGKKNATSEGDVLAVLKITTDTTSNFDVTIIPDTYIGNLNADGSKTKYAVGDETYPLVEDSVKVPVVAEPKNTVALADKIDPDDVANAEDTAEDAYLAIDATKGDNPATYGTDYVAYYNGVELTKDQLNNLLAGAYADDAENPITLEDVANGLTFKYNNGVNIRMQLVADGVVAAEETTEEDEPDPGKDYTAKGKIASNVSKSIKSTDKKQSATFTITPAKDKNGADVVGDTTVTINVKRTSFDAITGSGIEVAYQTLEEDDDQEMDIVTGYQYLTINDAGYEYELPESLNDKYIVSFTPAAKGTVEYVITYTDANGDKSTATAKYTVSASSTSGSGSGSSSKDDDNKSSGGGAIASGIVDSGSSYLPSLGFDDLGDVTWAQTAINTLAAKKIVSGVGDNKFDPNAALTRAAYAQMLVNAIGHSTDSADTYYDDVPTDAWFYHNVAVASQLGIVSGFGDGTFRPNDLITREQMALMTQKAAVVMGKSLVGADAGTFTDDADIADWSRDAVYQLSNAGIINGMGDGTFAPQANATRAQAAVIIYNAFVK